MSTESAYLSRALSQIIDSRCVEILEWHLWMRALVEGGEATVDLVASELRAGSDGGAFHLRELASVGNGTWRWAPTVVAPGEYAPVGGLPDRLADALSDDRISKSAFEPEVHPDLLAVACAVMADATTWLRLPGDGGGRYLLISEPPEPLPRYEPWALHALEVLGGLLVAGYGPLVGRHAVTAYLRALDLPVAETNSAVLITDGTDVQFEFDDAGLLESAGTRPGADPSGPFPQVGQARGVPITDFTDPSLLGREGWRDEAGITPIDVLARYLALRHAWEIEAAGSDLVAALQRRHSLERIYAEVATDRPMAHRDTSFSQPPTRNPDRTRVLSARLKSRDRATVRVQEDEPNGMEEFELEFRKVEGRWRIDDRIEIFEDGGRVSGLL